MRAGNSDEAKRERRRILHTPGGAAGGQLLVRAGPGVLDLRGSAPHATTGLIAGLQATSRAGGGGGVGRLVSEPPQPRPLGESQADGSAYQNAARIETTQGHLLRIAEPEEIRAATLDVRLRSGGYQRPHGVRLLLQHRRVQRRGLALCGVQGADVRPHALPRTRHALPAPTVAGRARSGSFAGFQSPEQFERLAVQALGARETLADRTGGQPTSGPGKVGRDRTQRGGG